MRVHEVDPASVFAHFFLKSALFFEFLYGLGQCVNVRSRHSQDSWFGR